ncbi:hypothetical protein A5686_08200 [Mycobacterium sp. E2479]|nr:hypothetical protein A5686_08200 [Mycobacterium sp. E2479]
MQLDALRCYHEYSIDHAASFELGDDEPCFNRFTQPDLVGEQDAEGVCCERAVQDGELVWEWLNAALRHS